MKLSVSETAARMGISIRTLHYYDEIGLLKPQEVTEAGYRYYGDEAMETLQQILFYRELQFSLKDIAALMNRPDYDKRQALQRQRELLVMKRRLLDDLLRQIDESMEENEMKKNHITSAEIEKTKQQYAAEVKERWGMTPEYAESEKKDAARGAGDEVAMAADADRIFAAFAEKMDREPGDAEVQALVGQWQAHISRYYYPCTKEILGCLGQMYTADERFTRNLDRFGDGNAQFMSDAIAIYCKQ